jgi:hypothetical protein
VIDAKKINRGKARKGAVRNAAQATRAVTGGWIDISRAEWRFVGLMIAAVWLITSLPLIFAWLSTPSDKVFMGIVLNVPDHAQYFMWFREHQNAFLINNKMTPEPNAPLFFNLLWWVLAGVGKLTGAGYAAVYQLMRVVGLAAFFALAYRLCAYAFDDLARRRFAFVILTLSSGFGWVLIVLKYTLWNGELYNPLDVFVAEGNTLLSAIGFPHFLAAAVYVWSYELFMRFVATRRWRYVVFSGLFAHFMGWQHAYDLILVWGVLGAWCALAMLRDRRLRFDLIGGMALLVGLSFPPALYSVLLTRLDPLWKEILAQFANAGVFTPPLYRLPVLLGLTLIAALLMSVIHVRAWRRPGVFARVSDRDLFVFAWFVSLIALVYIPTDFQIHMLNGWQIPMGILAARLLIDHVAPTLARTRLRPSRRAVAAAFVALILPTNIYLLAWRFLDLRRYDYDYYLNRADVAALNWIDANAQPDDVVLSSIHTGQYVPVLTGSHAYLAHWAQTADFFTKSENVARFFDNGTPDSVRIDIARKHSVDYVLVGEAERRLSGFDAALPASMTQVFVSGQTAVYRVNP